MPRCHPTDSFGYHACAPVFTSAQAPCWPVSGLVNIRLSPSQACVQNAQWLSDSASILMAVDGLHIASLTVAGAAQLRFAMNGLPSCFPLNCGM